MMSGCITTFIPITKNVAEAFLDFKISSNLGVSI